MKQHTIYRTITDGIAKSLEASHTFINIITGPRQVGKTTAAHDIVRTWKHATAHYANADVARTRGHEWIEFQWQYVRNHGRTTYKKLLVLDEIQKIHGWNDTVKALWDEDRKQGNRIKVLLLGSSSLLLSKGFSESLAGRFLLHRYTHWTYPECKKAFGWTLEQWLYFGGYPAAAQFCNDSALWKQYITDSLIETVITRDVLALQTVAKPSLLRNLFTLATSFPAQIVSYNKMLGQMVDAGNTTTLAHYLKLLETAFLVSGIEAYSGSIIRSKSSSPKIIFWNNALINAFDSRTFQETRKDGVWWGRIVENAVGAHCINHLQSFPYKIMYWRDGHDEVDFVVMRGNKVWAIEVKSGMIAKTNGLHTFCHRYRKAKPQPFLIGEGGMSLEEFFCTDPATLFF